MPHLQEKPHSKLDSGKVRKDLSYRVYGEKGSYMNIMKYIPKSKREAIRDAYRDEDGYWICLKEGWEASRTDSECRVIHEDHISDLRYQIAGITKL